MKKLIISIYVLLIGFVAFAQIPQNVNPGTENKESMWESPVTIVLIAVFILLLVTSRSWSKKFLRKRDDITDREKEEEEKGREEKDK